MGKIYDAIIRFDYPSALIPIRKKQDMIRGLIERTRGELAVASCEKRIDYKTGDINSGRYYKWAGCGLIGVGVSIPLSAIFKRKDYNISHEIICKNNKRWHFELK